MSEAGPELSQQRAPRAVAARRLASRSYRSKQRLFLAEGPQAVREAADLDGVLVELFATSEAADR
ncbi:MAG: RNA methyltransferase, partial [Catenulispora sp.]